MVQALIYLLVLIITALLYVISGPGIGIALMFGGLVSVLVVVMATLLTVYLTRYQGTDGLIISSYVSIGGLVLSIGTYVVGLLLLAAKLLSQHNLI